MLLDGDGEHFFTRKGFRETGLCMSMYVETCIWDVVRKFDDAAV